MRGCGFDRLSHGLCSRHETRHMPRLRLAPPCSHARSRVAVAELGVVRRLATSLVRTDAFQPPSWLSTLLFGASVFLLCLCLTAGFLITWLPETPTGDDWVRGYEQRESLIAWGGFASGAIAAVLAAWAWRSPRVVRFHAAFISGVALLVITFTYVRHVQSFASAAEHNSTPIGYDYLASPVLVLYSSALALLLILSAIICDRP